MYENGVGVTKNYASAARLYRIAAEQGHVIAQFKLGNMYAEGRGVSRDAITAVRWYRLAAEQGESEAKIILGGFYLAGVGMPVDKILAYKWLNIAAAFDENVSYIRDDLERDMTPAQIAEAQRLSREWIEAQKP